MKKQAVKRKRVKFEIEAAPKSQVFLAGTFNDWSDSAKELSYKEDSECHVGTLLLEPGEYEYKFIIDGDWQIDAENPNFTQNKIGTLNSVVKVEGPAKK